VGGFKVEECELGTVVPRFKYEVTLEEVDEILGEYEDGPFATGEAISATDIYYAPFMERWAAQLPLLHRGFLPRPPTQRGASAASPFENLCEWYDAMDELVPAYSCRVKGRAATWRARLAEEPYLEGKLVAEGDDDPIARAVPDLPVRASFDARRVWAAYAAGRPHLAATPAEEAAAHLVRHRERVVVAAADACALAADAADAALREVCAALSAWGEDMGEVDEEESAAAAADPRLSADARAVNPLAPRICNWTCAAI
jgi:hypothetical protein